MEYRTSNYQVMKGQAQQLFLNYNQEQMIQKLQLQHDEDFLYITFINRPFRVNRTDGFIQWLDQGSELWQEADFNPAMTIFDLLCYAKEDCHPAGEYEMMQNLSAVLTGKTYAGKGMLTKEAPLFDHREKQLCLACERLGGKKALGQAGKGDVAYVIPIFGEFSLLFRFWNSDEDFPASLQILCDKNTLQYMHYETIWYMVLYLIEQLKNNIK